MLCSHLDNVGKHIHRCFWDMKELHCKHVNYDLISVKKISHVWSLEKVNATLTMVNT